MSQKQIQLEEVGTVTVVKRRGARNIRLSVLPDGGIRVSLPMWAPYKAATDFVKQKREWIAKHRVVQATPLRHGQRIGKAHRIEFEPSSVAKTPTARLQGQVVFVRIPAHLSISSESVQATAHKASLRALRAEAEQLLPRRLRDIANSYGYRFASVSVRQLKTRWGSCSAQKDITLNYYLMQLPWPLIDYVLIHELVHTKHLNHSAAFWAEMEQHIRGAKKMRSQLKQYRPWLLAH